MKALGVQANSCVTGHWYLALRPLEVLFATETTSYQIVLCIYPKKGQDFISWYCQGSVFEWDKSLFPSIWSKFLLCFSELTVQARPSGFYCHLIWQIRGLNEIMAKCKRKYFYWLRYYGGARTGKQEVSPCSQVLKAAVISGLSFLLVISTHYQ